MTMTAGLQVRPEVACARVQGPLPTPLLYVCLFRSEHPLYSLTDSSASSMAAGLDSYGARKAGTGAGGQPPCSSVCEDLLAGCDTMISYVEYIFPLAVYFSIVGIPIDCSAEPTTDCVEGGKYE